MGLVYLAPRDQRHFLVLGPKEWRGGEKWLELPGEGELHSLASPYIPQLGASFPLEAQPAVP